MKKVEAFIRHEAFEPIRMELLELGFPSLSIIGGQGLRAPEGHHRALPRRRADELPAAEGQDRVRGRRRATCRRSSTRSSSTPAPARSATARCSSCRSRRRTGSAPASPARRRCRPTRTPRPQAVGGVGRSARWPRRGEPDPSPPPPPLVERLRAVHLQMVDAVLGGDGLGRVAELAADAGGRAGGDRRPAARRRRRCPPAATGRPRRAAPLRRRPRARPPGAGAAGRRRPRCRSPRATRRSAPCCCSATAEPRAGRARVPAPRRGRLPDRGRGRGGARGGRAEPARLVPGGAARAADDLEPDEVVRRAARLGCDLVARRGRAVRRAVHRPAAPRRGDDRRRVPGRARAAHGAAAAPRVYALLPAPAATTRRRRRWPPRAGSPRGCSATAPSACRRFYADPAELGRAIQEAELVLDVLRRSDVADRRGHRHRHLPAAVPRARLAPRGGALVLRGHGRADRRATTTSTRPTSSARSRPTSSATAT